MAAGVIQILVAALVRRWRTAILTAGETAGPPFLVPRKGSGQWGAGSSCHHPTTAVSVSGGMTVVLIRQGFAARPVILPDAECLSPIRPPMVVRGTVIASLTSTRGGNFFFNDTPTTEKAREALQ